MPGFHMEFGALVRLSSLDFVRSVPGADFNNLHYVGLHQLVVTLVPRLNLVLDPPPPGHGLVL